MHRLLPICLLLFFISLAACRREAESPPPAAAPAAPEVVPTPAAVPPPGQLEDVIETDPRYVIGISFPPQANRYPGLAAVLRRYADDARAELMEAVSDVDKPASPYDLALSFSMVAETPQVVAVAADGSSYTGGAHGNPLVARFVWLPESQRLLRAQDLIPDPRGWRAVSAYVREQLHAALSQRIDADELPPAERAEIMRSAGKMIDEGSDPAIENFDQFEPVLGADGRLRALRFVFPPYQVGPYSDGVQTVEVPATVLRPLVAPQYRDLFEGAPAGAPPRA